MASIQARKRTSGTPIFRVQFRLDKRTRSRSFGTIKAAKEFAAADFRGAPPLRLLSCAPRFLCPRLLFEMFHSSCLLDVCAGDLTAIVVRKSVAV